MNTTLRPYTATTGRILRQLRNDHRTVAMILVVPALLMTLLYFIYQDAPGPPHAPRRSSTGSASPCSGSCRSSSCSLITAIAMQRERTWARSSVCSPPAGASWTAGGYGSALRWPPPRRPPSLRLVAFWLLGMNAAGNPGWVMLIAMVDAVRWWRWPAGQRVRAHRIPGRAVHAGGRSQIFLCGLLVPRDRLPDLLEAISNVMPLSYAVDALQQVSLHPSRPRPCNFFINLFHSCQLQ